MDLRIGLRFDQQEQAGKRTSEAADSISEFKGDFHKVTQSHQRHQAEMGHGELLFSP